MRSIIVSVSALWATCLGATCAIAQTGQWGPAEDQIPPYHTHVDNRHQHDHVYPDRGAIVRDLPQGATTVNYAGISYRFAAGVWYERIGPAYMVVAPPIGVVVPQLPAFATSFENGGKTYLYADDVFYSPRPELGGYEVVNDPEDAISDESQAPTDATSSRPTISLAAATPLPHAAPPPPVPPHAAPEAPRAPTPEGAAQAPSPPAAQAKDVTVPPAGQAKDLTMQPAVTVKDATAQPGGKARETTVPPATAAPSPSGVSSPPANPTGVAIYPRNGQSADQQAIDRYACYRFAVTQSGFDPLSINFDSPPAEVARHRADYSRAQAACLEGRGYTVP